MKFVSFIELCNLYKLTQHFLAIFSKNEREPKPFSDILYNKLQLSYKVATAIHLPFFKLRHKKLVPSQFRKVFSIACCTDLCI